MTAPSILAQHVGHRTVLRDERHLHCVDCARTLVLTSAVVRAGSTSTSNGIPTPDQACPRHPGEWPATCGRCRSERLARPDDQELPVPQPTADVATRAAEVRATLPTATPTPRRSTDADAERMAQARAELAAREPLPVPGEEATS